MKKAMSLAASIAGSAALLATCSCVGSVSAGAQTKAQAQQHATKYPPIPPGPISLGVSASLSGPAASYGAFQKINYTIGLEEFNKLHPNGIDGHQVKLDIVNDESTVTGAVQAANQLVSDNNAAVISLTFNPPSEEQQISVMQKAKMPVLGDILALPNGSVASLSKQFPYVFGTVPAQVQYETNAGTWIQKKHYHRVAFLSDGVPVDSQAAQFITQGMGKAKGPAKVVGTVTITPGSVDDSAAIIKLKDLHPDLVVVTVGVGFGPIWDAMQSAAFTPDILANPGAWYSGFSSMGALAQNAYTYFYNCAPSLTTQFTPQQATIMAAFSAGTKGATINYFTNIASNLMPIELVAAAIEQTHSTSPAAIKGALEGIRNKEFVGIKYSFSPTNHYGLTGALGPAVCKMAPPYAGGVGKVPLQARP